MLCIARYVHNRLQLASVDMYQVRHVNTSSRVPGTNHLKQHVCVCVLVSSISSSTIHTVMHTQSIMYITVNSKGNGYNNIMISVYVITQVYKLL